MGIGKRFGFMKPQTQTFFSGSRPTLQERFKEITWEERKWCRSGHTEEWRPEVMCICEEILEKDICSLRKIIPPNNFSKGN